MREIKTNKTFRELSESNSKISVFQGGARSGKTFNILIWLISIAATSHKKYWITVCRATMPALKGSALRDFITILEDFELFDPDKLNKTELTYKLINTTFEFISIDQPQKIRGRKRDILFINEANEIDFESWIQLSIRTTSKIIIDYNPSMPPDHWIFEKVISRDDTDYYQSTYLDNPFLEQSVVNEIERLKTIDENYWKIYGLGIRGDIRGIIFNNWIQVPKLPGEYKIRVFGLDFGYTNDPTAIIEVRLQNGELWIKEHIYRRGMLNSDIIRELHKLDCNLIVADSAEPKSIDEIKIGGALNVVPSTKGKDSINNGIDLLKQYKINVTQDSINLIKELRNYKWDEKDGVLIQKPIDAYNHAIDALRYAVVYKLGNRSIKRQINRMPQRQNRL